MADTITLTKYLRTRLAERKLSPSPPASYGSTDEVGAQRRARALDMRARRRAAAEAVALAVVRQALRRRFRAAGEPFSVLCRLLELRSQPF